MGLSPMAGINERVDRIEARQKNYMENKYLQDNKLTIGLFSDNLNKTQFQKDAIISSALEQTKEYFNTTYQKCDLSTADISAILFEANPSFKAKIEKELPNYDKSQRDTKDGRTVTKKFVSACDKLSLCMIDQKNLKNRFTAQECGDIINEFYQKSETSRRQGEDIQMVNLGANKYINGDLADSDYDLMYDISQVGTILYKSYKPQPQIIFYNPPIFSDEASNSESLGNVGTSQKNGIGTAQGTQTSMDGKNEAASSHANKSQNSGGAGNQLAQNAHAPTPITEDEELNDFVYKRSAHSTLGNYDKVLFQNQCIVEPKEVQKNGPQTARGTGTPEEQQRANQEQQAVQKALEAYRASAGLPKKEEAGSGNNQAASSIGSNNIPDEEKQLDEIMNKIKECSTKCEGLPYDEKYTCIMQCACSDYISPALVKGSKQPVLKEGALIVRFCSVASSMTVPNTSAKNILSIAELFDEIAMSVSTLYNEGKLNVKQQKKELLSSSIPKSDISKSVAFTTTVATKTPPQQPSDTEKKTEIELLKSHLQGSIYGIDRNSFVLLDNYEAEKKSSSITAPEVASTPVIQSASKFRDADAVTSALENQSLLKENTVASMNLAIFERIEKNNQLMDTIKEVVSELKSSTQLLNSKKQAS
ncbi:MAG: hypothetical protein HG424_004115 [candidate division SR1 bacterium]|nr:hypothetical protein [candidate division SR1 bacterium]